MTAAELSALSDEELSEKVAVEIAGWFFVPRAMVDGICQHEHWDDSHGGWEDPEFATSADAVLPLLEKFGDVDVTYTKHAGVGRYIVSLMRTSGNRSVAPTLPRAACLALLLAKGAA